MYQNIKHNGKRPGTRQEVAETRIKPYAEKALTPQNQQYVVESARKQPVVIPRYLKFGMAGTIMDSQIVISLLSYDPVLFRKFLLLSPAWHTSSLQALDEHTNKIENQFVQAYSEFLYFKKSFTTSQPIKFCGQTGVRIDRVIQAELLPNRQLFKQDNKMVKFGYKYTNYGD